MPMGAEYERAGLSMAAEEDIPAAMAVTVSGPATRDTTGGIGFGGAKVDNTMCIHGVEKGHQVLLSWWCEVE